MDLLENYKNKNHIVYMDNYYNSVRLTELLLSHGIYVCGTLRQNRGTSDIFEEKFKKLRKEEIFYEVNKNFILGGYFDSKPIRFVSSFHQPTNNVKEKLIKTKTKIEGEKKIVY